MEKGIIIDLIESRIIGAVRRADIESGTVIITEYIFADYIARHPHADSGRRVAVNRNAGECESVAFDQIAIGLTRIVAGNDQSVPAGASGTGLAARHPLFIVKIIIADNIISANQLDYMMAAIKKRVIFHQIVIAVYRRVFPNTDIHDTALVVICSTVADPTDNTPFDRIMVGTPA
jgi:hypothetical protein